MKEVKRRVRTGLAYAAFAGKPFVLPAIAGAAKYLAAGPETHGRRAILMFGANAGSALSNQNHMGVAKDLWNAGAILSAVVMPTSWTRFIYDDNPYHIFGLMALPKINRFNYVDDVAEQTGGETIYMEDAGPMRADPIPTSLFSRSSNACAAVIASTTTCRKQSRDSAAASKSS